MSNEIDYDKIDPGVRELVRWLNSIGIPTTDSGDGVSKFDADGNDTMGCALDYPHVFAVYGMDWYRACSAAIRLHNELSPYDIMRKGIQLTWNPADGCVLLELSNFTNDDVPKSYTAT